MNVVGFFGETQFGATGETQKGCRLKEVQEWEVEKKKKGAYYNCGTKGHSVKECHEKKQDGKNKFKGSHVHCWIASLKFCLWFLQKKFEVKIFVENLRVQLCRWIL